MLLINAQRKSIKFEDKGSEIFLTDADWRTLSALSNTEFKTVYQIHYLIFHRPTTKGENHAAYTYLNNLKKRIGRYLEKTKKGYKLSDDTDYLIPYYIWNFDKKITDFIYETRSNAAIFNANATFKGSNQRLLRKRI